MKSYLCSCVVLFSILHSAHATRLPPPTNGPPFAVPGNLIVNGDFESGTKGWGGTYGLLSLSDYRMSPLPLSGSTVGIVLAEQNPMTQTIPTVAGNTYQLSLGLRLPDLNGAGIPIEGVSFADPALVNLFWNKELVQQLLVQNRRDWDTFTFNLTAQSSSTELAFSAVDFVLNGEIVISDSPFIDNVSLVSIPESGSTMILILIAIAVLAGTGRVLNCNANLQRRS